MQRRIEISKEMFIDVEEDDFEKAFISAMYEIGHKVFKDSISSECYSYAMDYGFDYNYMDRKTYFKKPEKSNKGTLKERYIRVRNERNKDTEDVYLTVKVKVILGHNILNNLR